MGRDITDEVEELTGSAGPAYEDEWLQPALNELPQTQVGSYTPTPAEIAMREKHERVYQRQNALALATQSFGDKLPLVDSQKIIERAREFQTFLETDA